MVLSGLRKPGWWVAAWSYNGSIRRIVGVHAASVDTIPAETVPDAPRRPRDSLRNAPRHNAVYLKMLAELSAAETILEQKPVLTSREHTEVQH